jgi:uncharacterized protein YchJ
MVNHRLKAQMIEAVDNQLRENNPKEAMETFNRLKKLGYDEQKTKEMIAAVLIEEMYYVLKNQETYNEERYTGNLAKLPEYYLNREESEDEEVEDFQHMDESENVAEDIRFPVKKVKTPGRNEPCICGSGKKYKKCCGK